MKEEVHNLVMGSFSVKENSNLVSSRTIESEKIEETNIRELLR